MSAVAVTLPGQVRPALVAALRRLLHPLVRLLVAEGVTYPFFADLLKELFVTAAREEALANGGRVTDSRLTLLSGVHRKDIRRLTREAPADPARSQLHRVGTTLIARWLSEGRWRDASGNPIALPRSATRGGQVSFAALAESVSADVRPRAILDELVRLGVVRVDDDELVHLEVAGFVPSKEPDAKAYFFGEGLHDHIAAAAHNLRGGLPPFLDRGVFYDELSPAAVERLAQRSEKLAMGVLTEINREAEAEERDDPPDPGQRMRMRLGVYYYTAPVTASPPNLRLVADRDSEAERS